MELYNTLKTVLLKSNYIMDASSSEELVKYFDKPYPTSFVML